MRLFACLGLALSLSLFSIAPATFAADNGDELPAPVKPPAGVTREQIEKHNAMAKLVHQAFLDIKSSRFYSADAELQQALSIDPACVEAHLNRVVVLCAMQKYTDAEAEANTVIKLEPHSHRGLMSKAAVMEERGDLKGATALIEKVIQQYPQLPDINLLKSKVALMKKELANQAVARASNSGSADDFFDFIKTNGVKKWKADKFPLKVCMPSEEEAAKITGYKPEFSAALKDAFNTWQTDSNEQVRFQYVETSADADIDCQWVSDADKLTNASEAGEARIRANALTGIEHVDIKLLTVPVGKNAWKNPGAADMKQVCLHEIGHALGLSGHSPNPHDIMFPAEEVSADSRNLSARDLKTLAHLYQPDIAPSAKPGSAEDVAALNAQGVELAKQGDYPTAMQKFETAFKYDSKSHPVRMNMSWCLSKQAAEVAREGDFQEALSLLQRALAMQGDRGDVSMRTNIMHNLVIVYKRLDRQAEAQATEESLQKLTMQKP